MPHNGRIVLRPLRRGDEAELGRIHRTEEVRRWWGDPESGFPWSDEPQATRFVVEVDGAVAGLIQFNEELEPRYRHASIDVFIEPALHGRGIGTAVVHRLARYLTEERSHHRVTIDPAAANGSAIRSYEKAGFRPVGIMRQAERDPDNDEWHDALLMELLADDPPSPAPLPVNLIEDAGREPA